ncbi:LysR family transcriptional regulator [Parahaliea maris]|uniref:LysR family transcriptional regulator n=1 Tax=Parahaliea maris TaxID=2716870 RepID=A0A5C9A3A2_9GAMM|nr:LysR substrate-binding domain-containing protein [Parahaliea maris]TXS95238.1 LysR family transcriptional regulator [Parahaliea maris]
MSRHLPSTQALQCFEAVARCGSVTRASEQLNMTQSAVSRQLRSLEDLLGVHLFERSRQRLRLNANGAAYLDSVTPALDQLRNATQRARRAASGHLCVGIEPALASAWLIPQLRGFSRAHPHISVELMTDMEKLHAASTQWDLAIVYGEPDEGGQACLPLMREHLVAVASPELLKSGPAVRDFADVLQYPIIHHTGPYSTSASWLTRAGLNEREIRQLPGPRMETFSLVQQCAQQGLGIAFLPTYFVTEALGNGSLVEISDLRLTSEQHYNLLLPQARHSPTVALFSDWLQSLAAP